MPKLAFGPRRRVRRTTRRTTKRSSPLDLSKLFGIGLGKRGPKK